MTAVDVAHARIALIRIKVAAGADASIDRVDPFGATASGDEAARIAHPASAIIARRR
jgi:hypothetical protein